MSHTKTNVPFQPLQIAVLTVSDTRSPENDTSGDALVDGLTEAGHRLAERVICKDDVYQLRAVVSGWIADASVQAILVTGGTGFLSATNLAVLITSYVVVLVVKEMQVHLASTYLWKPFDYFACRRS